MRATLGGVALWVALGGTAWAAPTWCNGIAKNSIDEHADLKRLQEDDDGRFVLAALVSATCTPDSDQQKQQAEIAAVRARWSQRLDMSDADWADAAAYATLDRGAASSDVHINSGGRELGIGEPLKRAWTSFDAIDQYVMLTAGSFASNDPAKDHAYFADALGGKLTALGRAGFVRECLEGSREKPVEWAICAPDVAQLDWKKIADELRADKAYAGGDKMKIRLALAALKTKLPEHDKKVKSLVARDPGYAKLFEVAAKARKEWEGGMVDPSFVELATAMDDARALSSRRAFAGCEDKTWAAWKRAVGAIPAKKYEGVRDDRENGKGFLDGAMAPIINSPNAYVASVAYTLCMGSGQEGAAEPDVLVRSLVDALTRWPGFRGPRTAAHTAVLTAGIELDDRDAKLDYPDVERSFGRGGGSHDGGGIGVIGAIKPAGKTMTVTFRKQMVKQQQCANMKYTHRITQILNDGSLVYEHYCTKWQSVTVDKSDPPQTVNAKYMERVKPGMFFSNIEDVVLAVWAKPDAAAPSMVFGVALK